MWKLQSQLHLSLRSENIPTLEGNQQQWDMQRGKMQEGHVQLP
jgi:hypothetical protein